MLRPACYCLLTLICFASCSQQQQGAETSAPPSAHEATVLALKYAQQFEATAVEGYTEVTVYAGKDRTRPYRYRLIPRGTNPNALAVNADIVDIEVPIENAVCLSTTHAALFEALDLRSALIGISGGRYLFDSALLQRLETGAIVELGESAGFDYERLVELDPDLVMSFVTEDPSYGVYPKLISLALPAVVNAEFREPHPLGQAEWIKFLGLLAGEQQRATQVFDSIEQRYLALAKAVVDSETAPTVFSGMPWKGEWTVPAGESFPVKYLDAAGANYVWKSEGGTGSLFLDLEQVMEAAGAAEIWLNPGAASSLANITTNDSRLRHFEAFAKGNVFNNNRRVSASGGNDYWESGIVYPDRVLSDLSLIVENYNKTDTSWQDKLWYYQKLK